METDNSGAITSDATRSIIAPVMTTTGTNGKRIVESFLRMIEADHDLFLTPTKEGFHVCMKLNGADIKLIQIWGKLDQTKSDILETRRQWLPESLQLTNESYRRIAQLFLTANFTPNGGKYRNYQLHFQDERKLQFDDSVIGKVTRTITGLKEVIVENSK
jgi:hypothetical protein